MTSSPETTAARRSALETRLLRRRAERAADPEAGRTISRVAPTDRLPLSSGQRRFLLLNELDAAGEGGHGAGNFAFWLRLRGDLDRPAMRGALDELRRRHAVLRTVFAADDEGPVQVVLPPDPVELPVHDFSRQPDPVERARAAALAMAVEPFCLSEDVPIRCDLLRLAEQDQVLLIRIHHVAADGWSEAVLNEELSTLYRAFQRGAPSPLPEPPLQYADYAAWQQQQLTAGALDDQLRHWQDVLADPPVATALPFDRCPTAESGTTGAVVSLPVRRPTADAIARLCAQHEVSLFQALTAGYAALLSRYSGQTDLVMGALVANRHHRETAGLIGFFVNTVALRVDTSGNPTFGELLRRVRSTALDAYGHQEVPFERVVERLAPGREPGRQPLVQTILQVHNTPQAPLELAGLDVEYEQLFTASTAVDLSASFVEQAGELVGMWEYRDELFDEETVRRVHDDMFRLIDAAIAQPATGIGELDDLSDRDRLLLDRWAAGQRLPDAPRGVLERWTAQVSAGPDAPAVISGGATVSYAALDNRANRLAHHLMTRGAGAEDLVGICLGRGVEMVVAVLAVLKAGAAYLPLDPAYPADRLRFTLADASPKLVITDAGTADALGPLAVREVRLGRDDAEIAMRPAHAPAADVTPDGLAYVIYTSGSTGRPKGVAVHHGGLATYLHWAAQRYGNDRPGGSALHSSLGFDLTVTSLLLPLTVGRSVTVVQEDEPLPRLAALLADPEQNFTLAKLTPSHLSALRAELAAGARPDSVGTFVVGGEALHADLVRSWREIAPRARFFNEYGPTEAVVGCCVHEVTDDQSSAEAVPIGMPVPDTQLYVLDAAGLRVRPGMVGELYIGGAQVVRGYLNRPRLTADRFVPDPFGTTPGGRLYRTGDLVRYRRDGCLEFLGRTDHQVKIHGRRVELGEVEMSLRRCAGVSDAVVVLRGKAERASLAAYYVPEGPGADSPEDVRRALAGILPEHMVPAAFVPLPELPMTENGKVDRAALPEPAPVSAASHAPAPPESGRPANRVEETIAAIWADVLGVPRVAVLDDFFALGGHSLLAGTVVERIAAAWPGLRTRGLLREVFLRPTVRGLSGAVVDLMAAGLSDPPVADPPAAAEPAMPGGADRSGPVPLSPAQEGLLVQCQLADSPHEYLVPLAMRLAGRLDVPALRTALGAVCDRHETLRSRFPEGSAEHCVIEPPGRRPRLRTCDVTSLAPADRAAEVTALLEAEVTRPLDLTDPPLLRALLVRTGPDEHVLCLCTHHLVFDGLSQRILRDELAEFYNAALTGRPVPPEPTQPLRYADLTAELRRRAEAPCADDLRFWRDTLSGTPVLELGTDRPRPDRRTGAGAAVDFDVPADVTTQLRRLAKGRSATLFAVLLAGVQAVLHRYTGQEDFAVGTSVAGRDIAGSERIVGLFVNQVVLRADLAGAPGFDDLVDRVRLACADVFAHQHVPFETLVQELRPARVPGAHPLFQVAIELAEAPQALGLGPDLVAHEHPVAVTVSKFDLTVAFTADGDRLLGELEYDTALFDENRMRALADDLVAVLRAAATDPAVRVAGLLPDAAQRAGHRWTRSDGDPETEAVERADAATDTVQRVAEVFRDALGLDAVGPDDDFFSLGGHSVLALRAVSRLRKAFSLDLPLDLLFRDPTARGLAVGIEELMLAEIEAMTDEQAAAFLDTRQSES